MPVNVWLGKCCLKRQILASKIQRARVAIMKGWPTTHLQRPHTPLWSPSPKFRKLISPSPTRQQIKKYNRLQRPKSPFCTTIANVLLHSAVLFGSSSMTCLWLNFCSLYPQTSHSFCLHLPIWYCFPNILSKQRTQQNYSVGLSNSDAKLERQTKHPSVLWQKIAPFSPIPHPKGPILPGLVKCLHGRETSTKAPTVIC